MSGFRANSIVNRDGTGAPNFPNGIVATGATFTGGISGVNGTFSGNLTIGGTVSYQEVENIDAVGVVTAQQGIQVEANGLTVTGVGTFNNSIEVVGVTTADANGLNVAGVITATTLKGSGANLTGVLPTLSGIASGALTDGAPVIIQSDGTLKAVGLSRTEAIGAEEVFSTGGASYNQVVYDSGNDKIVVCYVDTADSNYGKARVGTITGLGVTFGPATTFYSAYTTYLAATYVSNSERSENKIVIAFTDSSDNGRAIVGTVSGDTISFGSDATFDSTQIYAKTIVTQPDQNSESNAKIAIFYGDGGNSRKATGHVGRVYGTTIDFSNSSPELMDNDVTNVDNFASANNTSNYLMIAYRDGTGTNNLRVKIATISGDGLSYGGNANCFTNNNQQYPTILWNPDISDFIIAFQDAGNSNQFVASRATQTGFAVTFSSLTPFTPGINATFGVGTYDTDQNKLVYFFRDTTNTKGKYVTGTISGTTFTFNDPVLFNDYNTSYVNSAYDSTNNRTAVVYYSGESSQRGRSLIYQNQVGNLTANNFIGFSNAAYTDGQTATIQITGSVDDAQSGLTIARKHYVQNDGTLSTTAGSPSVEAGTAISATKIIVKG